MRIAIVGAGVSGLTAAHLLRKTHDVTVFEASDRPGGHAHTLQVVDEGRPLSLDTGFLVYNERTYPLFTRLLASLRVPTQPSDMSFSVSCHGCGLCYSGRGLAGLFAQPSNLVRQRYWGMLGDVLRFNTWARDIDLAEVAATATLAHAVALAGVGEYFTQHYLMPMTSAIWSAPSGLAEQFPLALFLAFFRNHGLLQVRNQPQWRTVSGGSRCYVERLAAPLEQRLTVNTVVERVQRTPAGPQVTWREGSRASANLSTTRRAQFDRVVLAVHADQALAMLDEPRETIARCLRSIPFTTNEAVLHTDVSQLPPKRAAWAAWNYRMPNCRSSQAPLQMTYYLNALQRLETRRHYCVTMNGGPGVDPGKVLARVTFAHPVYSAAGLAARQQLRDASGADGLHFCGAYLGNGFHEDGVRSAHDVAAELGVSAAQIA